MNYEDLQQLIKNVQTSTTNALGYIHSEGPVVDNESEVIAHMFEIVLDAHNLEDFLMEASLLAFAREEAKNED